MAVFEITRRPLWMAEITRVRFQTNGSIHNWRHRKLAIAPVNIRIWNQKFGNGKG